MMDCSKAGDAMLQFMEGKIKPTTAAALAQHVLRCEDCREYYLALDIAMEEIKMPETFGTTEAPEGFTASVMAKVRLLPAYEKTEATKKTDIFARVFLGVSSVILGVMTLLVYYQEEFVANITSSSRLATMSELYDSFLASIGSLLNQVVEMASQLSAGATAGVAGRYMPLAFVAILASVLFVLQRSEHLSHDR